jgi:hypothetical protein
VTTPFSKFAFLQGNYSSFNLAELDITNAQGYAMFMAIASANQGIGAEAAIEAYLARVEDTPLDQLCKRAANLTHMQQYNPSQGYGRLL